jgi:hypothetical protein
VWLFWCSGDGIGGGADGATCIGDQIGEPNVVPVAALSALIRLGVGGNGYISGSTIVGDGAGMPPATVAGGDARNDSLIASMSSDGMRSAPASPPIPASPPVNRVDPPLPLPLPLPLPPAVALALRCTARRMGDAGGGGCPCPCP